MTAPIKPCLSIKTSPTWGFGVEAEKPFGSLHTKPSHLMICTDTCHVPWMYDFYNKISITHSPSFILIAGVGPRGVLMRNLIGNNARLGCRSRITAISWGEEWVATVCCSHRHRWEVGSNPNLQEVDLHPFLLRWLYSIINVFCRVIHLTSHMLTWIDNNRSKGDSRLTHWPLCYVMRNFKHIKRQHW